MTEPRYPPNQCPDIDKAIKIVNNIRDQIKRMAPELKESDIEIDSLDYLSDVVDHFEEIRTECATLREWGLYWQAKAEEERIEV